MDGKRHPSSFQQLEKLGEGTYATVSGSWSLFSILSFITESLPERRPTIKAMNLG
jgi:hypothetical protein